ncbi:MAG: hypothetical protein JXQ26_11735 [Tissierellales bacterium]|nr:hypothetical protein [Tissierellales bacterium]MBN2828658.1 hypothetical protein [Tissierellales bacterium]
MATKSITKNIDIRSKHLGREFVDALENVAGKKSQEVVISKVVKEVKKDQIKLIFGDN